MTKRKALLAHSGGEYSDGDSLRWEIEEGLALHLLTICQNSRGSNLRARDLKLCLTSVAWLIEQHERLGHSNEAFRLRIELVNTIQASDGCSVEFSMKQLEVTLFCSQAMLKSLLFDKSLDRRIRDKARKTYATKFFFPGLFLLTF